MPSSPSPKIIPLILAGGSGTRLWPLSQPDRPKQFLALSGEHTLLQETAKRVGRLGSPLVVCHERHRSLVVDQLAQVGEHKSAIILEPHPRNTAPAIAVSALWALEHHGPDAVLLALPADHLVQDQSELKSSVHKAAKLAEQGYIATFGVKPTRAETGYGYLRTEQSLGEEGAPIAEFVEKPSRPVAERYLEDGRYYWNSGMFMFKAGVFIEELAALQPDMLRLCQKAHQHATQDADFVRLESTAYGQCPSISVDYAVMEHTQKAWAVPLNCGWTDIGSWQSLWQALPKDANGNATIGQATLTNCTNCLTYSCDEPAVATGLHNAVVVNTPQGTQILDKTTGIWRSLSDE
jgi:mannose-1-phosphate guanylyltransferase/mannose-6-phosphate isomerase